jgi:hypothetical protein
MKEEGMARSAELRGFAPPRYGEELAQAEGDAIRGRPRALLEGPIPFSTDPVLSSFR